VVLPALPISGSRGSEINIDGLPDCRMGESAGVEEIEFFSDSGEESLTQSFQSMTHAPMRFILQYIEFTILI